MSRFDAIRSLGELQCSDEVLRQVLDQKKQPVCFDSFEPAGRMPLAQGLVKSMVVNKLIDEGCSVKLWINDWVAEQKGRLGGGDVKKMRAVGEYMIEVWKAIGMKVEEVEFVWSSQVIVGPSTVKFWPIVLNVARNCKLPRMIRCLGVGALNGETDEQLNSVTEREDATAEQETAMERNLSAEQKDIPSVELLYPCIQCATISYAEPDICLLGMDKRNITEFVEKFYDDLKKPRPITLATTILPSLKETSKEMSRSELDSCIFMEDEEGDVKKKINKAFCPPCEVAGNPCIALVKQIVLPRCNEFPVLRIPEYGGNKTYTSSEDLCTDYSNGALHPGDLKSSLISSLNKILQPVREHFKNNPRARELLKQVKRYKMT